MVSGMTGVLLVFVLGIIYTFATQTARKYMFNAFWLTHKLFYVVYILILAPRQLPTSPGPCVSLLLPGARHLVYNRQDCVPEPEATGDGRVSCGLPTVTYVYR